MSKLLNLLQRLDAPTKNVFEVPQAKKKEVPPPVTTVPPMTEKELDAVTTQLIPVASGKGGVGKTNMSVNMSIALADKLRETKPDARVVLVDCDFGLPNADLLLQAKVDITIEDFVSKKVGSLSDVMIQTGFDGLWFLSGAATPSMTLSNLLYQQRQKFVRNIKSLRADYVILDLGASVHFEVLDFFSMVNAGVVVTNPEPTAMRDSYLFVRAALHRKIRQDGKDWPELLEYLDRLERNEIEIPSVPGLLNQLHKDGKMVEHRALKTILESFVPKLIMNRSEDFDEGAAAAKRFRDEARRELGVDISYLGPVMNDPHVIRAVKESVPFIRRYPNCDASEWIRNITEKIMDNSDFNIDRNFFSFGSYIKRLFTGKNATKAG
ncbi:MAG: P-loop NTPase [Candidatus Lindowbacteria bacterium]|nr:P-loop NTPase [Candidatus Lindowbacteria bacterium]